MAKPSDTKLYSKVKSGVYKKYPTHSAYRSGILVQQYKREFKKKHGLRRAPYTGMRPGGLTRWFKEKWRADDGKVGYSKKNSVYRPTVRVTRQDSTYI